MDDQSFNSHSSLTGDWARGLDLMSEGYSIGVANKNQNKKQIGCTVRGPGFEFYSVAYKLSCVTLVKLLS